MAGKESEEGSGKVSIARIETTVCGGAGETRVFLSDGRELTGLKFVQFSHGVDKFQEYVIEGFIRGN